MDKRFFPDTVILASSSPGRKNILRNAGFEVVVMEPCVDENDVEDINNEMLPETLAAMKGEAVTAKLRKETHSDPRIVIAADTLCFLDDEILRKPSNREDAMRMLSAMSGNWHKVITGYWISYGGKTISGSDTTRVKFRPISFLEVENYLETEEYKGKAGAYAIQGIGGCLVEKIDGCYFNVCGLPLSAVWSSIIRLFPNLNNKECD